MINLKPINLESEFINVVKTVIRGVELKAGENVKAQVVDVLPSGGVVLKIKGILVEVQSEIPLQKDTQLLLQILPTPEKGVVKLRLLSLLPLKEQTKLNFTKLENIISSLKNWRPFINFKELPTKFWQTFSTNFITSYIFSGKELKDKLLNTGIFLEKRLKENKPVKDDIKGKLLKILNDPETPKEVKEFARQLLSNIESYQMISKLSGSFFTYIPILLPDLKISQFVYRPKEEKGIKIHNIFLDLEFTDIGKLLVHILYQQQKKLYINFYTENKSFADRLLRNSHELLDSIKKEFPNAYINVVAHLPKIEAILSNKHILDKKV